MTGDPRMGITMCPGPLHHPGTRTEDRGEVGGARLDLARNVFCLAGIQADTVGSASCSCLVPEGEAAVKRGSLVVLDLGLDVFCHGADS